MYILWADDNPNSSSGRGAYTIDDFFAIRKVLYAWTGATSDWDTGTNWNPNGVPAAASTAVSFGDAGAGATVNLANPRTVGSLAFAANVGTTISATGGSTLTLDNGASPASVTVAGTHTISAPLVLNSNLAVSGAGQLLIDGPIAGTNKSISVAGPGKLTLASNSNTYSGATNVTGGTLAISADANLGNSSGIALNGGTLEITSSSSFTTGKWLTVGAGGGTVQVGASATAQFTLPVSGTAPLTKSGAGTMTMGTYAGAVNITGGTLSLFPVVAPGLSTIAFKNVGYMESVNDMNWNATPSNTFTMGQINIPSTTDEFFQGQVASPPTGYIDNFAVQWTGYVRIDSPGSYYFSTESDDGSILDISLDGGTTWTTVGNSDGWHPMSENGSTISFPNAGYYKIRERFFEQGMGAGCIVRWIPAGSGTKTVLPASVLFGGSGSLSLGAVNVSSGATLDLNGNDAAVASLTGAAGSHVVLGWNTLTVGGNNASTTYAGDIIGPGGSLNKIGTGTLTLTGDSSGFGGYNGATTVSAGKLVVNSPGKILSTVMVNSGAALGGNGSVGGAVLNSGARLTPGPDATTIGTLTAGTLALNAGSIVDFKFAADGSANDLVDVTQFDGLNITTGAGINLYVQGTTNPFTLIRPAPYKLFQYTGMTPNYAGLSILNPGEVRYTLGMFAEAGNTYVGLTIGSFPVWNGGSAVDGGWSRVENWNGAAIQSGDVLTFDGAVRLTNTNDQVAITQFRSLVFRTTAGDSGTNTGFTLGGNGITLIGDSGGNLIRNDATIPQTVNLPLTVGAAGKAITTTNAAGTTVLGGPIDNGGNTVTVGGAGNTTIVSTGSLSGNGGLTKTGAGTLTMNAATTYVGDTRITTGALVVGHSQALQGSVVDMNAADTGTLSFAGSVTAASFGGLKGARNIALSNASSNGVTLSVGGGVGTYSGQISGANGALVKEGGGRLTLTNGTNSYGQGTTITGGVLGIVPGATGAGTITLNGGTLALGGAATMVSGFGGNGTGWQLNSNGALPTVTSDVLRLTDGGQGQARSAFHNTKVSYGPFSASFVYTPSGNGAADGATFALQNDSRGPIALGGDGGSLGYSGIAPSASVQFNIYGTTGTAFNINGQTGNYSHPSWWSGVNSTPRPIRVDINYDGANMNWTLTDVGTPANMTTYSVPVNLGSVLGGSGQAYVGFTGGAGSQSSTQDISNFSFGGGTPTFASVQVIGGSNSTIAAGTTGATVDALNVGNGTTTLNVAADSGTMANAAYGLTLNTVALAGGSITLDVANNGTGRGTLSIGTILENAPTPIIKNGPGTLAITGVHAHASGITLTAGQLNVNNGGDATHSAVGTGTLTIAGGTLDNTSAGDVTVATNNAQNWNGDFAYAGSIRNLNLGAGAVLLGSNVQVTVTANNLTVGGTIAGAFGLVKAGAGALTLSGASTYSGGMSLDAGRLNINNGGDATHSAIGTGMFTISGGSIDNTSAGDVTLATNNLQVWNGDFTYAGSTRNLNLGAGTVLLGGNRRVTVAANTLTVDGSIEGSYSLTKAGAGTLVLSGVSNYNGATAVNGGKLVVSAPGQLANSTVTVNAGGTLSGDGSVAGIVVAGGRLAPGTVTPGATLTTGMLTLNPSSILDFKFKDDLSANDRVNVTNADGFTFSGGGFNLYRLDGTTPFSGLGTFRLMQYTGTGTPGSLSSLAILNPIFGLKYGFQWITDSGNNYLGLNIRPIPTWVGNGTDGKWSTNANWNDSSLVLQDEMLIFQGPGQLVSTNDLTSVNRFAGLIFPAGAGSFTIGGNGLTLIGNDDATLIRNETSAAQAVNLPITVGAAGLSVSTPNAAGSTALGGTLDLNGQTLTVSGAGNTTIGGKITGAGLGSTLTKTGAGKLTLGNADNDFAGGITLNAGTLSLSAAGNLGLPLGPLTINNGSKLEITGTGFGTAATTVAISGGAVADVTSAGNTATFGGSVGGSGGLNKNGAGTLVLAGADNGYTGTTNVAGGTLQIDGSVSGGGDVTIGAATFQVNGSLSSGAAIAVPAGATLGIGPAGNVARDVNVGGGAVNLGGAMAANALKLNSGSIATLAGTPKVGSADFSSATGTVNAAAAPLAVATQLKLRDNYTASFTPDGGATSFAVSGSNVADNVAARTLALSGGTLALAKGISNRPTFQYYKFTVTANNGDGYNQFSELHFYRDGVWTPATGGSPGNIGGTGESDCGAANDLNRNTKFGQGGLPYSITFNYGGPRTFDSYNWATANDSTPSRNPTRWKVEGSNDNSNWTMIDDRTGTSQGVGPTNTYTWAGVNPANYVLMPGSSPPQNIGAANAWELGTYSPVGGTVNLPNTSVSVTASSVLDLQASGVAHTLGDLSFGGSGGILTLSGAQSVSFNNVAATAGPAQVAAGTPIALRGGQVDVQAGTLTIAAQVTGTAINKSGAGTLVLSAVDTYTGATSVAGGTLRITGSALNTSGVSVSAGTLDLAGSAGSVLTATTPVVNNGSLDVSSTLLQNVRAVSGTGATHVAPGASLVTNSIVQDTLTIGAGGSVTIRAVPSGAGAASDANAVPEPGTLILAAVGAVVLLAAGYRRRNRRG
jgi:autotransporter-associated beta strand protein